MEYVELSYAEQVQGRKTFIQSEISLLEAMKHAREYKKLRATEYALKTELRRLLEELDERVKKLASWMPHVKEIKENHIDSHKIKRRKDLELEIEALKDKLALMSG